MEQNGYVRRPELDAHLKPMLDDIAEIKGDVKSLLRAQARFEGEREATRDTKARYLAVGALVLTGIGGAWWVPAALGLTH